MNNPNEKTSGVLITINFEEKDGWHIATSPDLPGFILADPKFDEIIDDLPEAIRILYSSRHKVDCKVVSLKKDKDPNPWWALLPLSVIDSLVPAAA